MSRHRLIMRMVIVLYEVTKMQDIIQNLMETRREPNDYVGEDGLLYCGKCCTPKQTRLPFDPRTGKADETIVPVMCRCRQEANEEMKWRDAMERFQHIMARRYEDGISSPDGLQYTFEEDDRRQAKVSDACKRYVKCWDDMLANNIGVLLYGNVGTGKSFLASCIGNGLLDKQVAVAATNFPRLLNLLQGTFEKQELLDRLAIYKLLIVDDLGVERDSAYAEEQIFNIIDARSKSRLPVIVTTNFMMEEMENPISMQYARIFDRVLEMCPIHLKLVGESRRKENAAESERLARKILFG